MTNLERQEMSQVTFPVFSAVDPHHHCVNLPVVVDGETFVWKITEPAMQDNFAIVPLSQLSALLEANRSGIEHAIFRKIGEGARGAQTLNSAELMRLLK